jgi:hypothetical protein
MVRKVETASFMAHTGPRLLVVHQLPVDMHTSARPPAADQPRWNPAEICLRLPGAWQLHKQQHSITPPTANIACIPDPAAATAAAAAVRTWPRAQYRDQVRSTHD